MIKLIQSLRSAANGSALKWCWWTVLFLVLFNMAAVQGLQAQQETPKPLKADPLTVPKKRVDTTKKSLPKIKNRLDKQSKLDITLAEKYKDYPRYTIGSVSVVGNKRTKPHIILREMTLLTGYKASLPEIKERISKDENKIFNIKLFLEVKIKHQIVGNNIVNIEVTVKERWYIYPLPVFELKTRTFNEWWVNFDRDLSRIVYGLNLDHVNMRGRGETASLRLHAGFSTVVKLLYKFPTINKKQNIGLTMFASYEQFGAVPYGTKNGRQLVYNENKVVAEETAYSVSMTYRHDFYTRHYIELMYIDYQVDDVVTALNSDYLLDRATRRRYGRLFYNYKINKRDRNNYPLSGSYTRFDLEQYGLGSSPDFVQTELSVNYAHYFALPHGLYLSGRIGGNWSFPAKQSFLLNEALGFGRDKIRGYELYSIYGGSFLINKLTLKKRLFSFKIHLHKLIKWTEFNEVPFDIYVKLFSDRGYVFDSNTRTYEENESFSLKNRLLQSFGVGIDLVTYYDFVIRLEYSRNSLDENNFAVNFSVDLFN